MKINLTRESSHKAPLGVVSLIQTHHNGHISIDYIQI